MTWSRWEKMKRQWEDWQSKASKPYDTELVGRQMQGFRIDLDAVTDVSDIQLIWEAQERHQPASVPKERKCRTQ